MPYDYGLRLWLTTMKLAQEMAGKTTDIFPEFFKKIIRKFTEKASEKRYRTIAI